MLDNHPGAHPGARSQLCTEKISFPQDWKRWHEKHLLGPHEMWELTRRFGMPTGLTAEQTIWLIVDGDSSVPQGFRVWLNNEWLQAGRHAFTSDDSKSDSKLSFSVREKLSARNELRLLVAPSGSSEFRYRSVYLEIY